VCTYITRASLILPCISSCLLLLLLLPPPPPPPLLLLLPAHRCTLLPAHPTGRLMTSSSYSLLRTEQTTCGFFALCHYH
jgi:hypothetical protein